MGISLQPLQDSYNKYEQWMTPSWLKSLWEKCDPFDVMVEFNNTPLELPHCVEKWLMREFLRCVFSADELKRFNRVRIHMQVLFLSDILSASGKILYGKYLVQRKTDEKWSKLNPPKEQPPNKDFTLWKAAIRQVVPSGVIIDIIGNVTLNGHKTCNWRQDEDNYRLLHYIKGAIDIYKATQLSQHRNTTNSWTQLSTNQPAETNGNICSVQEVALALVEITSTVTHPCSQEMRT